MVASCCTCGEFLRGRGGNGLRLDAWERGDSWLREMLYFSRMSVRIECLGRDLGSRVRDGGILQRGGYESDNAKESLRRCLFPRVAHNAL